MSEVPLYVNSHDFVWNPKPYPKKVSGFMVSSLRVTGLRIQGVGLEDEDVGLKNGVRVSGLRLEVLRFTVWGLGLRCLVLDFRIRIWGSD